ncbi:MAG: hypothetical protein INR73_29275 [Williamsia sp.]|nr:hypothetical protein [Williamsia sp.]
MLIYQIGKRIAHPEIQPPHMDGVRAGLLPAPGFFNVFVFTTQPKADKQLATAELYYTFYQKDDVPFFVLNWPKLMVVDTTFNAFTQPVFERTAWQMAGSNMVNLIVLNAHTCTIEAMRTFSVDIQIASALRFTMSRQTERYQSAMQVEQVQQLIQRRVPISRMIEEGVSRKVTNEIPEP